MRPVAIAVIATGFLAQPAGAVINLQTDRMPEPGHVQIVSSGYYAPYDLKVIGGQTYAANPLGSGYHWGELWTSVEAGLLPEASLVVIGPLDVAQRFSGADRSVGLRELSLGVARTLWSHPAGSWKSRIRASMPLAATGPLLAGNVPGLGLENAGRWDLIRDRASVTVNLNYLYRLRQVTADPATRLPVAEWKGQRVQVNVGLAVGLAPHLTGSLEALGTWDGAGERDRRPVAASGGYALVLAPGLSYAVSRRVVLHGGALVPVVRGGYQASHRVMVMGGVTLEL